MTSLLWVSDEAHKRILTRIGVATVATVAAAATAFSVGNPFGRKADDVISVAFETPYAGQGVADGTPVIMHGMKVGEVTDISSLSDGGIRLRTRLQKKPLRGLTDRVGIDFQPANYFGVTGINLTPAAGGQPLRDGVQISIMPKGNFTLQALLYRLGALTHSVVTPQLISVVERATRYTDALVPLLQTMITVSTSVTEVQTVSTAQLLRNTTGINVALPGFFDALVNTGDLYLHSTIGIDAGGEGFDAKADKKNNPYMQYYDEALLKQYNDATHLLATNPDDFVYGRYKEWLKGAETDLFSKVGNVLSSHINDLFPIVDDIRVLSDVVPKLVPAGDIAYTLRELRTRLERMYAGSEEQRALQVRLVLDQLPGLATPMGLALGAAG